MRFGMLTMAVLGGLCTPGWADIVTFNSLSYGGSGPGGSHPRIPGGRGGQFNVTATNLGTFDTFCLEINEHISIPATYQMVLNTRAMDGGGPAHGGGPNGDPLDYKTAWLYLHFRAGDLNTFGTGYQYQNNVSADALQEAIWTIEEELPATGTSALALALINLATAQSASWTDYHGVRVMNITDSAGNHAQDQLALIPAPGAALLGIVGLSLASAIRRRIG